jgi:hypothetical protein
MFNELFFRSDALTRQLSAPLVEERRQYLDVSFEFPDSGLPGTRS